MSLRLIVVDDDEVDRYLVRRTVRKWDRVAVVEEVPTGRDALQRLEEPGWLERQPEGCRGPAVMLLDANMPGASGFDVLDAVTARFADVDGPAPLLVMLTSSSNERDRSRVEGNALVCAYLVKPLTVADLDRIAAMHAEAVG